ITIEREGEIIDQPMIGDEIRIEQVLINFLTNAIKYSPDADRVIIKTERDDVQIMISVIDFGIGIPPHKQKDLFDKFYRVEETSIRFQGLGIGLYICAEIIRQHHGTYGIRSQPEQGSTFYFTLPFNQN